VFSLLGEYRSRSKKKSPKSLTSPQKRLSFWYNTYGIFYLFLPLPLRNAGALFLTNIPSSSACHPAPQVSGGQGQGNRIKNRDYRAKSRCFRETRPFSGVSTMYGAVWDHFAIVRDTRIE
jgi:hypothetical protein